MKTIAVVTPNSRDFNIHVLSEKATQNDANFIQVTNLNSVYELKVDGFISLTNSIKMPNLKLILEELKKRLI
jgi:hypothetical protein